MFIYTSNSNKQNNIHIALKDSVWILHIKYNKIIFLNTFFFIICIYYNIILLKKMPIILLILKLELKLSIVINLF